MFCSERSWKGTVLPVVTNTITNFLQSKREIMFDQFWAMWDVARQTNFIINHTVTKIKKRQAAHSESKNTTEHQLSPEGNQI